MDDIPPNSPAQDFLPYNAAGCRLAEHCPGAITWIAPFKDRKPLISDALNAAIGCFFPPPNRLLIGNNAHAVSMAPGEALILGAALEIKGAACVDQSDAWAVLHLSGDLARDVLARLTPVDVREPSFPTGHTARTLLGHLPVSLSRLDHDTWEILVFRSMTQTAVRDLRRATASVAARQSISAL